LHGLSHKWYTVKPQECVHPTVEQFKCTPYSRTIQVYTLQSNNSSVHPTDEQFKGVKMCKNCVTLHKIRRQLLNMD